MARRGATGQRGEAGGYWAEQVGCLVGRGKVLGVLHRCPAALKRQRRRLPRRGEATAAPDCHGEYRRSWPWRGEYWQKYSRPPPRLQQGCASASGTGRRAPPFLAPRPSSRAASSEMGGDGETGQQRRGQQRMLPKATGRGDRAGRCILPRRGKAT